MLIRPPRLLQTGRRWSFSKLIITTVIVISLGLFIDDAFRPSAPAAGRAGRALRRQPPDTATDSAVFGRLQALLETVPAGLSCRHWGHLGGRCFQCYSGDGDTMVGQTDGRKPTCLDWLRPNCSVLSFGVNNDFSFEDAMADLGCTVHAFDPTMGRASYRRSERVFFHSVGVSGRDGRVGGFPVVSLASAARRARLQAGAIDSLKLDVEGSEWDVLLEAGGLGEVRRALQLAVEFHLSQGSPLLAEGVGIDEAQVNPRVSAADARRFAAAVRSLQKAGFVLTQTLHSVPCQKYTGGCLPFMYETVWANAELISKLRGPSRSSVLM